MSLLTGNWSTGILDYSIPSILRSLQRYSGIPVRTSPRPGAMTSGEKATSLSTRGFLRHELLPCDSGALGALRLTEARFNWL